MFIVPREKRLVNEGDKFGMCVAIGAPFYVRESGGKRRQAVVCQCSCGEFFARTVKLLVIDNCQGVYWR